MDWYVLVLRIFHIGGGVFWAGVGLFMPFFMEKAIGEAGPAGPRVMGALALKTRYPVAMASAAGLTVLSGILLYLRDSGVLQNMAWMSSGFGVTLTVGAICGIIGFGFGIYVGRLSAALAALGDEVAKSGNPPTPEQGAKLGALSARLSQFSRITALLVAIAVLCMATARYVSF